jgi:hypothetical protein
LIFKGTICIEEPCDGRALPFVIEVDSGYEDYFCAVATDRRRSPSVVRFCTFAWQFSPAYKRHGLINPWLTSVSFKRFKGTVQGLVRLP